MRITIDTDQHTLVEDGAEATRVAGLYTAESFATLSRLWLKVGWVLRYSYSMSWLGRPVIQLPEDMIRAQEVIYRVQPDVIVETGVAHGGSLVYYASLCKILGKGRVIGVDIDIRPQNRQALEAHSMFPMITLVEGDSVAPETVQRIKSLVQPGERAMVFLDSCHTKRHVLAELEAYAELVAPGSYIVATDGIMHDLSDVPRGKPEWVYDNPLAASLEFLAGHPEFEPEQSPWPFNESALSENVTYWPGAWLKRKT